MTLKNLLSCVWAVTLCCIAPAEGQDKSVTFRLELLNPADYLQALEENNWNVDEHAREMIEQFATKELFAGRDGEQVTLEILNVRELGFTKGATYGQICKQAATRNLQLCNPVDVVELCKAYENHSMTGQSLLIATKPIRCKDGNDYIFLVKSRNRTQRVLNGWQLRSEPDSNFVPSSATFVFEIGGVGSPKRKR